MILPVIQGFLRSSLHAFHHLPSNCHGDDRPPAGLAFLDVFQAVLHTSPSRARLHSTLNLFGLFLEPIVLVLYSSAYSLPQSNILPLISDFTRVQPLFRVIASLCNQLLGCCAKTSQTASSSPIPELSALFSCHL